MAVSLCIQNTQQFGIVLWYYMVYIYIYSTYMVCTWYMYIYIYGIYMVYTWYYMVYAWYIRYMVLLHYISLSIHVN